MDLGLAIGLAVVLARLVVPLFIIRWPLAIIACLVLDAVDQFARRLDGRKIAVDDGVDQSIGKIVGPARAQPIGHGGGDALAHRIEGVAFAFLEGDDEGMGILPA